ncbi:hypothetical protein GCK72_016715 [Caenorhabditis remanei]|uniref:Uncharacterized protein n=1 Tax=Caenorhabditis remanei TaxID=31234 RepID=A0A6A5G571_CAERE|nr:hypothetical protein GCK72_016715 [Caenorhabditis remanei]KAF1750168.1 hypothetical protein GCK72_016715 [Caenorhabditis remanei]
MNSFFLFLLTLLTICVAQEDSGRYVDRIKIETFSKTKFGLIHDSYTYYVKDSYDQIQKDYFPYEFLSIGYLYEDDYAADTVSCATDVCPKLRRIYAHTTTVNGKVTTRLLDSALKASLGATTAKPIGFVAPYPGYCSSDDLVPIIEMYSDYLKQYVYWTPLRPHDYTIWNNYPDDLSRYVPKRLVGYALSGDSNRTVLYNAAPDFVKPIGKANYTHSFFPTYHSMIFIKNRTLVHVASPAAVDAYLKKTAEFPINQKFGVYVLGKGTAAEFTRLSAVCGELMPIYTAMNAHKNQTEFFARTVAAPYTAMAQSGWTFKENRRVCGGIRGLAPLREFKQKTSGHFVYMNDPDMIAKELGDLYEVTSKNLGYAPLDQFGFLLVNATI